MNQSNVNMWGDSVKQSYKINGGNLPDYIASVNGVKRQYYKNENDKKQELLPGLLKERFLYLMA